MPVTPCIIIEYDEMDFVNYVENNMFLIINLDDFFLVNSRFSETNGMASEYFKWWSTCEMEHGDEIFNSSEIWC